MIQPAGIRTNNPQISETSVTSAAEQPNSPSPFHLTHDRWMRSDANFHLSVFLPSLIVLLISR